MTVHLTQDSGHRLSHFTPLRYPGGKGKLAPYVKRLIAANNLFDGEYVEPYAGGAAIALELLFHEYVSSIRINDISKPVYCFWKSVLDHTDELCKLIVDTTVNVDSWDIQKKIFMNPDQHSDISLGFAMFFLNRTNRSGILNGGVIGGRDQKGKWKIDARYNHKNLVFRIESIAKMKEKITVTQIDAEIFLRNGAKEWGRDTLIYCDPPYYVKGRDLYHNYYVHADHQSIARIMTEEVVQPRWIVSYDNVSEIRDLYTECPSITYTIGYSARTAKQGSEIMFFSDDLNIPDIVGAMGPYTEPSIAA